MAKPRVWIRTAEGVVKRIPKRNWQAWAGRGAVQVADPATVAVVGVSEAEEPEHIGGGYYKLPDGSTVRGREAAGLEG